MKRPAVYIVWVENRSFRHHSLAQAQRRAALAHRQGKACLIATTSLRHSVYSIAQPAPR